MLIKLCVIILLMLCLSVPALGGDEPLLQDLEREVTHYHELIKADSRNARYLNCLGFACYRLNRLQEAVDAYLRSISYAPQATTFNNLGAAYLRLKEYGNAEQSFRKALQLDAFAVKAAYNLAVALYRKDCFYAAYQAYRHAQQIDASYVKKRFNNSTARNELQQTAMQMPDKDVARLVLQRLELE